MQHRRTLTWDTIAPRTRVVFTPADGAAITARIDEIGPLGEGFNVRPTGGTYQWVSRADVEAGRVVRAPSQVHSAAYHRAERDHPHQEGDHWVAACKACDWETEPQKAKAAAEYAFATGHRR
ncbi:hypothetical protein [Streptacidiphilus sp. EB103A]|uniref:hypothetical protein n=1 Tax=Streptacidiphilus sp. EB103A TaxID=3156275 RepID=UPI003511E423